MESFYLLVLFSSLCFVVSHSLVHCQASPMRINPFIGSSCIPRCPWEDTVALLVEWCELATFDASCARGTQIGRTSRASAEVLVSRNTNSPQSQCYESGLAHCRRIHSRTASFLLRWGSVEYCLAFEGLLQKGLQIILQFIVVCGSAPTMYIV